MRRSERTLLRFPFAKARTRMRLFTTQAVTALLTAGVMLMSTSARPQSDTKTSAPPRMDVPHLPVLTPGAGDGDYRIGPPYAPAPELTPKDNVPKGKVYRFTMQSTDSAIYPGISRSTPGKIVAYERRVSVYVPSQY